MLYSGSNKPLYEQMKEVIIQKIHSGEYVSGDCLPGERALMQQYGVSRITIRQAIGALVNEGIVYRKHGKGTFVAEKKVERPLASLLGIAEELTMEDIDVTIDVLKSGIEKPSLEVRKALGLHSDQSVFMVKRLISTQQSPLVIINDYVSESIKYVFDNCILERDIFYVQLEKCGYKIGHGEQRISAGSAADDEVQLLKCKKNAPILVVKRTTFDTDNNPLIYSNISYRGDKYEYFINLKRRIL